MITILCSMAGLGFYTPGVVIQSRLRKSNISSELLLVETFYYQRLQTNLSKMKELFRKNYNVANLAHKTIKTNKHALDQNKISLLLKKWLYEKRKHFIVLSGFWLPVLQDYAKVNQDIVVDLCHLDSYPSTSWKMYNTDAPCYQHIWFTDWASKKVGYTIKFSESDPVKYNDRNHRYISHGGGWGIGTYQQKAAIMVKNNIPIDVTVNDPAEAKQDAALIRYFMMHPDWRPELRDEEGFHTFPPLGEIKNNTVIYRTNQDYPEIYNMIRKSKAMIAKPGAASLLESFASATPLIILAPYGEYEKKNGLLWEQLGFGICFDKWLSSAFDESRLRILHENMIDYRNNVPDYMERVFNVA